MDCDSMSVIVVLLLKLLVFASSQPNASPVISNVSETATFSWMIPHGRLGSGSTFHAVDTAGRSAFAVLSYGSFITFGNYTGRVTFLGNITSRNITFTMTNIQTSDAGTYRCGGGGASSIITNCGQMLIVLQKPTTPGRPIARASPVYNQQVTLTCHSTSNTLPADHGLTLTYSWQQDGSDVRPSPGFLYSFTVTSRDTHNYSCKAKESQGLESEWGSPYSLVVEYSPYQISLTPSTLSYTVTEDQDTISPITCSANCRPGCNYRWFKNGTIYSTSSTLSLGRVVRSQIGSYSCQPYNKHGNNDSSVVIVDVLYPPDVRITTEGLQDCRPYIVYVGQQNVRLACQVLAANPGVTSYRWKQNSYVISSATDSVLTISSVTRSSGGSYTCQGNNGISTPSYSKPVSVDVQYSPSVTVASTTKTVIEGQALTVTCSVLSNPTSSVTWTRKDGGSFTPQTGSTLTITNIQRSQTGTYVCTATNTLSPCGLSPIHGTGTDEVTVNVQYPASIKALTVNSGIGSVTVDENTTLNLTCHVDSNPRSTISLMNGNLKLARIENSLTASYNWKVTCRQRGTYSCTASNNIGTAENTFIKLTVKCSPKMDDSYNLNTKFASRLGGNVTLIVPILAYPVPTSTWSRQSTSQNLTGSFIPVSDITGNITLTLTNLNSQDFGDYNLTMRNGVGHPIVLTVTVVPETPPYPPANFSTVARRDTFISVEWISKFNGGARQTFHIAYQNRNSLVWTDLEAIQDPGWNRIVISNVTALSPGTLYYIRLYAENQFGRSSVITVNTTTIKVDVLVPQQVSNSLTGLIVGSILGVLVVLIIIASLTCLYRKGYRCRCQCSCAVTKQGVEKNRDQTENEDRTYSTLVIDTTQSGLQDRSSQHYTGLSQHRNAKDASDPAVYEGLRDKSPVTYEDLKLHVYENTTNKTDPSCINVPKS